jgi:hypothetical protein
MPLGTCCSGNRRTQHRLSRPHTPLRTRPGPHRLRGGGREGEDQSPLISYAIVIHLISYCHSSHKLLPFILISSFHAFSDVIAIHLISYCHSFHKLLPFILISSFHSFSEAIAIYLISYCHSSHKLLPVCDGSLVSKLGSSMVLSRHAPWPMRWKSGGGGGGVGAAAELR